MKKIYAIAFAFLPLLSFAQFDVEWQSDSIKEGNPGDDVGFYYNLTNPGNQDIDITWIFTHDTASSQDPNTGENIWQDYMCEGLFVCWPYTKRWNTFTLEAGEEIEMYHHIWMMRGDEGDTGTFNSTAIIFQADDSANTVQTFNITLNIVPVDSVFSTFNGKDIVVVDGDTFELYDGGWVPLGLNGADRFSAVLGQNAPNPFNGWTNIEYALNSGNGTMKFHDLTGKLVMERALNQQQGVLTLQGELDAGIYFYSLWEDGQMIDSKRMQVVK